MSPMQQQERAEAITARLRFVADRANDPGATGVYTLPSTGKRIDFGRQKNGWKLSRLLYKVGELRLTTALGDFIRTEALLVTEQDAHAFVRTLGMIGSPQHAEIIGRVGRAFAHLPLLQRTVQQSLLQLQGAGVLGRQVSTDLATATTGGELTALLVRLTRDDVRNDWLYPTYLYIYAERPALLPILLAHLSKLPARGNYFQPIRYILKAAEQLGDLRTLATLQYWIWRAEPVSVVTENRKWDQVDGRWQSQVIGRGARHPEEQYDWRNPTSVEDESRKMNTKWGFTSRTRRYLVRRLFRRLDELGQRRDAAAYTGWATEFLLAFNEAPLRPAFEAVEGRYTYDEKAKRYFYTRYTVYHPEAADLAPLHWVINGGENGLAVKSDAVLIRSLKPLKTLTGRRERYPELWDQRPRPAIRLLGASRSRAVQDFALRVFAANPSFANAVNSEDLLAMLSQPNPEIVSLAFNLARTRPELLTEAVIYELLVHDREDVRFWARNNSKLSFATALARVQGERNEQRFERALDYLHDRHTTRLAAMTDEELGALTLHPLPAAGVLVAKILERQRRYPYRLILRLMTSPHANVRVLGIELFGRIPVEELYANHLETIAGMCVAEEDEIRNTAAPIARRLAERYPDFGGNLVNSLVELLLSRGKATDIHVSITALLTAPPLAAHLKDLPEDLVWRLVRSRKAPTQAVGLQALVEAHTPGRLTTEQLVELGRHDFVDARAFARQQFLENADRTVYDSTDFLRILDNHWEDSRTFAMDFLRNNLKDRDWTPEVLVAILDIPRDDVQAFALEFIERHVPADAATNFLLRAGQHPAHRVQEFAAGWLSRYAAGKPEVIRDLLPFFRTLLGQISRGRLAKDRVFDFLEKESLDSEPIAQLTQPLLERLMLTIATGDRARCWQILNKIRRRYAHLPSPLHPAPAPITPTVPENRPA